jgi:cell division protein ZipA
MAELRWILLALGVLVLSGLYVWGRGLSKRNRLARAGRREREEPRLSLEADLLAEPGSLSDERFEIAEPEDEAEAAPGGGRTNSAEPVQVDAQTKTTKAVRADRRIKTAELARADRRTKTQSKPDAPHSDSSANGSSSTKPAPKAAPDKVVTIRFVPRDHELGGETAVAALRRAGLKHGRYGIFHRHAGESDEDVLFSVANLTEPGTFDLERLRAIAGMSFFVVLPSRGDPVAAFDAMVETARALAHDLDADLFDDRGSSWSIQRERYVREELIHYRHQHAQH